jgi:hypothetical protein
MSPLIPEKQSKYASFIAICRWFDTIGAKPVCQTKRF